MKKSILLFLLCYVSLISVSKAQFGFIKKSDVEIVKDSRIIVVLFNDSAYNASIQTAFERNWKFNGGYLFVHDTMLKPYMNKPEYMYLVFSKSKASPKLKIKACSSEDDLNGLLLTKKFKRKVTPDLMVANAFCSNKIDTTEWYAELTRAVQMMNNFFEHALMAKDDKSISFSVLANNYPGDKSSLSGLTLYGIKSEMGLVGKEDAAQIWGGDFEELMDKEEIDKLVLEQNKDAVYYYFVKDEKYCNKLFIKAENSEVMYYTTTKSTDACKCTAKDLKALKEVKTKANKD